jgi:hypothetical protein
MARATRLRPAAPTYFGGRRAGLGDPSLSLSEPLVGGPHESVLLCLLRLPPAAPEINRRSSEPKERGGRETPRPCDKNADCRRRRDPELDLPELDDGAK